VKRFKEAHQIWHGGASNPRAVARALVNAIDEAAGDNQDPAVQMILDHLCFLCDMPQPSLTMSYENWELVMKLVEEQQS
jgi:hypothetical protein